MIKTKATILAWLFVFAFAFLGSNRALAFSKLQLLMPGETAAPGTPTGKTGTPTAQTAGTAFTITVNAVDANWNLISANDTVHLASTDPNAVLAADAGLVGGTGTFSVTLNTSGS